MQTINRERLDELSLENRQQLQEQIEHVQREARKLRAQARRLRRAQNAETRERKKLLAQMAEAGRDWGQGVFQRGNHLAASGISLAGDQLRAGQQKMRQYGGNLVQGVGQLGNQTSHNLTDWGEEAGDRLLKQGQLLGHNASDWSDEAAYRLRKQGQHLVHDTSDWGDEAAYRLRRQGRSLFQTAADWGDELLYRLRRRSRNLGRNLVDRREDTARQFSLQKRYLGRNLSDRREDATRQIRRQGRNLGRNLVDRRDDTLRQVRKQRDYLSERGGQLLEPVRESKVWSILGFVAGLLLAGGVTYWLVKRGVERSLAQEEESIELEAHEPFAEVSYRPHGEIRATTQGGMLVATRLATSASPTTRFVGILSSRRYYPIGRSPDASDLVYFEREEDAVAEGFRAAE